MVIALLAYLGAALGLVLLIVGRRGRRVDDHPTCRKCRFDLVSKPLESGRCSECGAELSVAGAVVIGNRERRQVPFVVGAFLLLLCGFTAAGLTFLLASPASYSPTWYLLSQAQRGDDGQKAGAFRELEARVIIPGAGSIIDRALTMQADITTRWDERWGDLIEHAQSAGTATPTQWERYLGHIVTFDEHVRPRIALNEGILVVITNSFEPRRGSGAALSLKINTQFTLRYGGNATSIPGPYIDMGVESFFGGPQKNRFPVAETTRLGAGTRHITIEHSWDVIAAGPPAAKGHGGQEHALDLTILPEGTPSVTVVPRPDLAAAVEKSLFEPSKQNQGAWKIHSGEFQIEADRPPMDLAFRLYFAAGGDERLLGPFVFRKGQDWQVGGGWGDPELRGIPDGPAEIIFRPAPEAAADTPDIFEIYGGEVRKPVQLIRQ